MRNKIIRHTSIVCALLFQLVAAGCDTYDCTPVECGSGNKTWQRCLSCGGESTVFCSYQARDNAGEVLDECDYTSDALNTGPRDACFDKTNAAGESFCAR